ncbi:hypothetical protein WN944_002073 [Citrus x changshan-huyou]|uniref:Uncharacterized protein n=1 Tax=Citrus x changshan-huyou TaxID=2935761 RepID=A0AAP0MHW3_9ROSI
MLLAASVYLIQYLSHKAYSEDDRPGPALPIHLSIILVFLQATISAELPNCTANNVFVREDRHGNRNEDEDEVDWFLHVSMALLWWDFGVL